MNVVITTLFGLESLVAEELQALGYDRGQIKVSDGQVVLDAGPGVALAVARLNVQLRTAERVLVQLAQYEAQDFDLFFDKAHALPWEDWIDKNSVIIVNGYSRKSALFGIPACQSLLKKAIVSRLAAVYGLQRGSHIVEDPGVGTVRIQFGIVNDLVTLMVDTSGDGLHKRGYRPLRHEAPLKETLAAALVQLSMFRPGSPEALLDPFCGSGTIPIEAALLAYRIAPGIHRAFAGETWSLIGPAAFAKAREEAADQVLAGRKDDVFIFGSDLSPQAVSVAMANARSAGVGDFIRFRPADINRMELAELRQWTGHDALLVIGNPPYGERLLDQDAARQIYEATCNLFIPRGQLEEAVRLTLLTSDKVFEQIAGRPADKRRKLYNGMIQCMMYHYFRNNKGVNRR